jgi:branched-chain amino acid transport system ATP-binding protein
MRILSIKNIFASYGKKEVLKGIDIYINEGEIVSLFGPNGAGKSTVLRVIMGILKPVNGSIYFKDIEITNLPVHKRAQLGISYLIQGGSIFTNLSVIDNLKLAVDNSNNQNLKIFEIFPELEAHKNTRAGLLSGGLKQMLSISMLLVKQPKILLLDEPSAGLAPLAVKNLLDKINLINKNFKIPILLVEQNIRYTAKMSSRIYLLKNGTVEKEYLTSDELITSDAYEKIFFET